MQKGGWVQTDDKRTGSERTGSGEIRITLLIIWLGRACGMEAALQALKQGNVEVGVLQETMLKKEINTRYGAGYAVWATEA